MEFPVAYFESNLIFTQDKKCWAAYEAVGFQYDYKSSDSKKEFFQRMLGFFWNMERPVRLLLLPEVYTFQEHFEKLKARTSGPFLPYALSHADATREFLEEGLGKEGTKYKLFVMVNIDQPASLMDSFNDLKEYFVNLFRDPKRKTERFMGVSGLEIFENEMKSFSEAEDRVHRQLHKFIPLNKLTEKKIDWIIRRNFWKGISIPPDRFLWQEDAEDELADDRYFVPTGRARVDVEMRDGKRVKRPRLAEFMSLSEGDIDLTNRRQVKLSQLVGSEEVSSYSSYLTVSELPDRFSIPGSEYLYQLHELDFPVAASVYIDPIPYEEAKSKVRLKKMDIDDQSSHTASAANDLPINLVEARNEALMLEKDLDDNKFPMLDTSIVFEVVASNPKDLLERVDALRDFYGNSLKLVNPAGEQWQLFNEFLPAGKRLCSIDYVHRITPHAMAASMVAATKRLGDDEGFFIGTTGILNQPVFFDPSRAPRINRSGSGAFIGSLGGGKSFTANFLSYLLTAYGAKTLIFDPKGDRGKWKEHLVEFGDDLEVVTLADRPEDYGKLDPWGMHVEDVEHAAEVSINIISFLANVDIGDEEFIYLTEATNRVKTLKKRSMMTVVNTLANMPEPKAQFLARKLTAFSTLPNAKLLFYDGQLQSININRRMTVLQVARLSLPEADTPKSDYSISEMLSIANMFSITSFATALAEDPSEFTAVVLDEFWAINGTKEGKKMATRLIRTGRSFYAAVFIISQNADDLLDEKIKNNLGFKFVFKSTDNDEILKALRFLDLEPTEENVAIIKGIENGKPLFSDLDGHCGIVEILPIFTHIKEAFNTTAGKKQKAS